MRVKRPKAVHGDPKRVKASQDGSRRVNAADAGQIGLSGNKTGEGGSKWPFNRRMQPLGVLRRVMAVPREVKTAIGM